MLAETFAKTIRAFAKREPFRPFVVELVSGNLVQVKHLEALVFGNKTAVYVDPEGDITIFDHQGVARITDVIDHRHRPTRR